MGRKKKGGWKNSLVTSLSGAEKPCDLVAVPAPYFIARQRARLIEQGLQQGMS